MTSSLLQQRKSAHLQSSEPRKRHNVLLLFSKVPQPGKVKTRLTVLKDGVFQPNVASGLYHCMLFDVAEIICAALADLEREQATNMAAKADAPAAADSSIVADEPAEATLRAAANLSTVADGSAAPDSLTVANAPECNQVYDTYELVISTTPAHHKETMQQLFEDAGTWPRPITFIYDEGASFDEHYNDAFQQCWQRGADCILSLGADMPALTKQDVIKGFRQLHTLDDQSQGGIVLAPDQEMGVSTIGWTRATKFDHSGVFYNKDGLTVLPAYIDKARKAHLPVLWLPPIPDVDTMADLMHAITIVDALCYAANYDDICPPWRTANALKEMGWDSVIVPPNDLFDPRDEIDTKG